MNKKVLSEKVPEIAMKALAAFSFVLIIFIFIFIFSRAWPVLRASGIGFLIRTGFDAQIRDAFYSSAGDPMLVFGMYGLISGTIAISLFAVLIASVAGVGGAIAICELAPRRLVHILTAFVRLLASIPSVIFGLIGIITVVPMIQGAFVTDSLVISYLDRFQITGRGLLASIIVLTFMVMPTVISLSIDAINAVPISYKEAGFAFGMSKFRVIWIILLPTARSGIKASIILAFGRGIGEAIAVSMVCGGLGIAPDLSRGLVSLLAPVLPLSSAIINKSEAMGSSAVEAALFSCAAILLIMGTLLSLCAKFIAHRQRKAIGYDS